MFLRWLSCAVIALQIVEALAISSGGRKDMIVAIASSVLMSDAIALPGTVLLSMVITVIVSNDVNAIIYGARAEQKERFC